ncbi:MAG: hypothetical protein HC925_08990 [Coleofasciculaceae cyanobacterium SM2_3_26]|nr:hypothetical protein [Coleofasciculaceae cyanobacterium SM2_3_26]
MTGGKCNFLGKILIFLPSRSHFYLLRDRYRVRSQQANLPVNTSITLLYIPDPECPILRAQPACPIQLTHHHPP